MDFHGMMDHFSTTKQIKNQAPKLHFHITTTTGNNLKFVSDLENFKIQFLQEFSALSAENFESVQHEMEELQEIYKIPEFERKPEQMESFHRIERLVMGVFIEHLSIEDPTESSKMVLEVFPEFISNLDSLKKLTLKYDIAVPLPNIDNLQITYAKLPHKIPDSIYYCKHLVRLSLEYCHLRKLDAKIGLLEKLVFLDLSHNRLSFLPPEINNLVSLTTLILTHNSLSDLPVMSSLVNLEQINLNHNAFASPRLYGHAEHLNNLGTLANLKSLTLQNHGLTTMPNHFSKLTNLEHLDVSQGALTELKSVGEKIKYINVSNNKALFQLDSGIGLTLLKEFHASECKLSFLPTSFALLATLTHLELSSNAFLEFPRIVCECFNLKALILRNNQIETIPVEIMKLERLKYLNLENNKLKEIPSLAKLQKLKHLNLNYNFLSYLSDGFQELNALTQLELLGNNWIELPVEFSRIKSLVHLEIADLVIKMKDQHEISAILPSQPFKLDKSKLEFLPVPESSIETILRLHKHSRKSFLLSHLLLHCIQLLSTTEQRLTFVNSGGREELVLMIFFPPIPTYKIFLEPALKIYLDFSRDALLRMSLAENLDAFLSVFMDDPRSYSDLHQSLIVDIISNILLHREVYNIVIQQPEANQKILQIFSLHETSLINTRNSINRLLSIYRNPEVINQIALDNEREGYRILSLDGGGIRGLVTIIILQKIEELTGKKIHELFDLVIGTSTGSIIASLVGIQKLPMKEIAEKYRNLCRNIFRANYSQRKNDEPKKDTATPGYSTSVWSNMLNYASYIKNGYWYASIELEKTLQAQDFANILLIDSAKETKNKVCIVSTLCSVYPMEPYVFKNYFLPNDETKSDCEIELCETKFYLRLRFINLFRKAIRGSTAAPTYFIPLYHNSIAFRDGGLLSNNPTPLGIQEGKKLWPHRKLELVLSVGTGYPPIRDVKNIEAYSELVNQVIASCTETEKTHLILKSILPSDTYIRLQPANKTIFEIDLDETSEEKLDAISLATMQYVDEITDSILKPLCEKLLLSFKMDHNNDAVDNDMDVEISKTI